MANNFSCSACALIYTEYTILVEHLYWRHGTEGGWCVYCELKRWDFAPHYCGVLPHADFEICFDDEDALDTINLVYPFCYCGKDIPDSMVGCDGPGCKRQWYHFSCMSLDVAPEGDWYCPECVLVLKTKEPQEKSKKNGKPRRKRKTKKG